MTILYEYEIRRETRSTHKVFAKNEEEALEKLENGEDELTWEQDYIIDVTKVKGTTNVRS